MELLLEVVIEFFLELVVGEGVELQTNPKVPKWLRITLGIMTLLVSSVIIVGCIVLGVLVLKETLPGGIAMIFLGVLLLVCGIWKLLKMKKQREKF